MQTNDRVDGTPPRSIVDRRRRAALEGRQVRRRTPRRPETPLAARRREMQLEIQALAAAAGIPEAVIRHGEDPNYGHLTPDGARAVARVLGGDFTDMIARPQLVTVVEAVRQLPEVPKTQIVSTVKNGHCRVHPPTNPNHKRPVRVELEQLRSLYDPEWIPLLGIERRYDITFITLKRYADHDAFPTRHVRNRVEVHEPGFVRWLDSREGQAVINCAANHKRMNTGKRRASTIATQQERRVAVLHRYVRLGEGSNTIAKAFGVWPTTILGDLDALGVPPEYRARRHAERTRDRIMPIYRSGQAPRGIYEMQATLHGKDMIKRNMEDGNASRRAIGKITGEDGGKAGRGKAKLGVGPKLQIPEGFTEESYVEARRVADPLLTAMEAIRIGQHERGSGRRLTLALVERESGLPRHHLRTLQRHARADSLSYPLPTL